MDKQRRKELKKQYREMKTYMGVYQVISTSSAVPSILVLRRYMPDCFHPLNVSHFEPCDCFVRQCNVSKNSKIAGSSHMEFFTRRGCDLAQGFYFGESRPIYELIDRSTMV
ncbi:MAG: hypothetical protein GX047_05605 [Firmicutes bacterium]|nr:hypothetical protein [Bacillota bacterium]